MAERKYYVLCESNCKFESMTKEQILTAIQQAVETGEIKDIDTGFITTIKEQNRGNAITLWKGTQAEYNALTEKPEDCFYIITDDTFKEDINKAIEDQNKEIKEIYKNVDKKTFEVKITATTANPKNSEYATSDKTFAEITAAAASGKKVIARVYSSKDGKLFDGVIYEYYKHNSTMCIFMCMTPAVLNDDYAREGRTATHYLIFNSDNTFEFVHKSNGAPIQNLWDNRDSDTQQNKEGLAGVNSYGSSKVATITLGYETQSESDHGIALGYGVAAHDQSQMVVGKYNERVGMDETIDSNATGSMFIVGVGTSEEDRRNAFRVTSDGKCMGTQAFVASGADYAEYFEWEDGNTKGEDRRGLFVTLDGDKIRLAKAGDTYILGVVSATPSVVGNAYTDMWQGRYLTDVFGEWLTEQINVPEKVEEKTGRVIPAHIATRFVVNPEFDATKKYIGRNARKEWAAIGTHGQLIVIDDGTSEVNGYCTITDGGIATKSADKTEYRVLKRIDETHIKIYIK